MLPRPWNLPSVEIDPSYCMFWTFSDGFAESDMLSVARARSRSPLDRPMAHTPRLPTLPGGPRTKQQCVKCFP